MKKIWNEIKERFGLVAYTFRHYMAFQRLARKYGRWYLFHDVDKMLLYPLLGKKLTTRLHRAWSAHHCRKGIIVDKVEAAIDWECARFTKPDKPLNAFETWRKYYPNVDMGPTLEKLGLMTGTIPANEIISFDSEGRWTRETFTF